VTRRPDPAAVRALVAGALTDLATAWTVGGYGAALAFARRPDEPASLRPDGLGVATARGALAFGDLAGLVPVAYETALGDEVWSHAVALCVAAAPREAAAGVTELGPDRGAVRPEDREAVLFDLGLGLIQARICLRAGAPEAAAALRAARGLRPLDDEAALARLLALPCDRVVLAGGHRAEAAPGGLAAGPRLQMLPKLLRLGRTHAATAPLPPGLVPLAIIHPPHPLGRAAPFDRGRHEAFQALLAAWGDPELADLKRRLLAGEAAVPDTRAGRAVARVARAQRLRLGRTGSGA
jgi:hypothetical protein